MRSDPNDPPLVDIEYLALQDLFEATNGEYWIWEGPYFGAHWNFTEIIPNQPRNPCAESWQGLNCTCDLTACNIEIIKLQQYNMTGTIPSSIGSFSVIDYLDLYGNFLKNLIPKELGLLTTLTYLAINGNSFTSSIPSAIGSLVNLIHLDVSDNALTGVIPSFIGEKLLGLEVLLLDRNSFNGPLPDSLGQLSNLTEFTLALNPYLNGSIPASFGNMTSLSRALWYTSALSGSLPASLGNLHNLVSFEVYDNKLEGAIPDNFCNMKSLGMLALHMNDLTGPIPECIGDLKNLQAFYLFKNHLSGTLPMSIYNLVNLYYFEIYVNDFSGTIDESVGNFASLYYFQINFNGFEGTLPKSLSTIPNFLIFDVSDNQFTGPLADDLGNQWSIANYVMLYDNMFTGTLPASLSGCSSALYLLVSDNHLEGTIPDELRQMSALQYLDIRWNHFSGAIPYGLSELTSLFYLALSSNELTGTIPRNLTALPDLRILFVDENKLSGSLSDVFNVSAESPLTNIDLGNNGFTGSIPVDAFKLKLLSTFAANTNCFTGTIPEEICQASQLTALVLDGISSGETCRNDLFPDLYRYIKTYGLEISQLRSLPDCLFSMPALQTLHLSGNSITGTLSEDVTISTSLTDLALSHNDLAGTIPSQFMMRAVDDNGVITGRNWINLDLSYNRLTGVMNQDLEPLYIQQSLSLQENRISGEIPDALEDAEQISILEGNMFACDLTGSDLPSHDSASRNYECGSQSFNISIYLWIALFGLVVLMGVIVRFTCIADSSWRGPLARGIHFIAEERKQFLSVFDSDASQSMSLIEFDALMKRVRTVCLSLTAFIVLVCLPTFSVLSSYYGTYDHEYAWFFSAAFLSGKTAAIVVFTTLVVLMFLFVRIYTTQLHSFEWVAKKKEQFMQRFYGSLNVFAGRKHSFKFYCFVAFLIVMNCAVVLTVNGAYIYISLTYNRTIITVAQIGIALFKLYWNSIIVFDFFLYVKELYFVEDEVPQEREMDEDSRVSLSASFRKSRASMAAKMESRDILVQTFIVMFNNIAAPCLAVAVVSSNCFYYALFTSPAIDTSYSYLYCTLYILNSDDCSVVTEEFVGTTYNPPFVYSYACSSAFITTYASVYVYKYIIRAFVVPLVTFACGAALKYLPQDTLLYRLIQNVTPSLVKPIKSQVSTEGVLPWVRFNYLLP